MKPILNRIQDTILQVFKENKTIQAQANILKNDVFSLEEIETNKFSSTRPTCLWVFCPFPVQSINEISEHCWEKLSLQCLLTQKFSINPQPNFLELAEEISYTLSHKNFSNDVWEGCFTLSENHPWEWINFKQGNALKINFTTSNLNLLI